MIEGYWYTTIGTSPHAVFNTIWAAYVEHDWHPLEVTIFRLLPSSPKQAIQEKLDSAYTIFAEWLTRFKEMYDLNTRLEEIRCQEEDYVTYAQEFRKALRKHSDSPRAIDITPGRKFASAMGLETGIEEGVDSIFYLHLLDDSYADLLFPQIPRPLLKLVDFRKGVGL